MHSLKIITVNPMPNSTAGDRELATGYAKRKRGKRSEIRLAYLLWPQEKRGQLGTDHSFWAWGRRGRVGNFPKQIPAKKNLLLKKIYIIHGEPWKKNWASALHSPGSIADRIKPCTAWRWGKKSCPRKSPSTPTPPKNNGPSLARKDFTVTWATILHYFLC